MDRIWQWTWERYGLRYYVRARPNAPSIQTFAPWATVCFVVTANNRGLRYGTLAFWEKGVRGLESPRGTEGNCFREIGAGR